MTGCPNGCARPYTGDIGIVGRMTGYYALYNPRRRSLVSFRCRLR
jgi:sulfite reductase beta subunit-like hemoprotein